VSAAPSTQQPSQQQTSLIGPQEPLGWMDFSARMFADAVRRHQRISTILARTYPSLRHVPLVSMIEFAPDGIANTPSGVCVAPPHPVCCWKGSRMKVTVAALAGLLCGAISTPSHGQQATATEVYSLRERCGKLAAAVYQRDYSPSTQTTATGGQRMYNYENHYSQKLNKCFYLEVASFYEKAVWSQSMRLYDLNENKEYGHYWQSGNRKNADCSVGEALCSSEDEFRKLAKPYLED